mmetsp:Transcript_11550/g.17328  ORF Transcript_11550/g.17328 Transcript_11550/m.17328 type:complete len:239 (-) Transcript_11550:50-766(-)
MSRLAAYWGSLADSQRSAISVEELCSFEWSSRMKGWAGPAWTISDPWWQGSQAATRRYYADGTTSGARGAGRWRFVPKAEGRTGPEGSFVRHSRSHRDFPTHFVSRWNNWGWILQNCWGFSASFPLPLKGEDSALEDDGDLCQSVTVETCGMEASRFNLGLPLPYEDRSESGSSPEDSDEEDGLVQVRINGSVRQLPRSLLWALLAAQNGGRRVGREPGSTEQDDTAEGEESESAVEE